MPNRIGALRDFAMVFSRIQRRDFCGITVGAIGKGKAKDNE
jgi:hypothetical protein